MSRQDDEAEAAAREALCAGLERWCVAARQATGSQVAVALLPSWSADPVVSLYGNDDGFAALARGLLDAMTSQPRSTSCPKCAAAWDAMQTAKLALVGVGGDDQACH